MLNMVSQAHSDYVGGRPRVGVRFFATGVITSVNPTIQSGGVSSMTV
jgi:hypothetical protein